MPTSSSSEEGGLWTPAPARCLAVEAMGRQGGLDGLTVRCRGRTGGLFGGGEAASGMEGFGQMGDVDGAFAAEE
jgi:hypothetical protein